MPTPRGLLLRVRSPAGVALLACTLAIAACSQPVSVRGEWQDEVPRGQTFSRVLVLGLSPDLNQRCAFERFLVSSMKSGATTAIASCDVIPHQEPISREAVERAIAKFEFDAVLATSLVTGDLSAAKGGSRDTRGSAAYKAVDSGWAYYDSFYGVYGVPVIYGEFVTSPSITTLQGEVELLSRLYETRGATVVYAMATKARDLQSRGDALATVTPPIADRLRREGLIR